MSRWLTPGRVLIGVGVLLVLGVIALTVGRAYTAGKAWLAQSHAGIEADPDPPFTTAVWIGWKIITG